MTSGPRAARPPVAATGALHRAGVAAVIAGERSGDGRIFGTTVQVAGIDPGLSQLLRLRWTAGSDAAMAQLGAAGAIVDKSFARSHHLAVGSPLHLETSTGKMLALRVTAINDPPTSENPRSARSRSRRARSTRPTRTSPPRTRARSTTWLPASRTPGCRARPSS